MEFLHMNLTTDLSLLLHTIHSLFFTWTLKKTIVYSGLKLHTKKARKQEKSSLFVEQKNKCRKPDKIMSEKTQV
jgi:hypothetical protein